MTISLPKLEEEKKIIITVTDEDVISVVRKQYDPDTGKETDSTQTDRYFKTTLIRNKEEKEQELENIKFLLGKFDD